MPIPKSSDARKCIVDGFLMLMIGFTGGFLLQSTTVFIFTGIPIFTLIIIIAAAEIHGRKIAGLFSRCAITNLTIVLLSMWITAILVNQWWKNLLYMIPDGLFK